MATRVLLPREQVFSNIGIVGAGYRLFFYETGTTTKKDTYSDEGLTTPNTNPVVADSAGRFGDIWISDSSMYKCVLAPAGTDDPSTNPIWTADPINADDTGILIIDPLPTAYWGVTSGTSTAYLLDIPNLLVPITSYTNKQCFFVDFHIACGASPTININDLGVLNLKKYSNSGTKIALEANDLQVQRYLAINDGIDIVILNPGIEYDLKSDNLTAYNTINGAVFSRSPIISNNVATPNTILDFTAGSVFDSVNNIGWGTPAWSKTTAAWVAGTGNGGLDTGTVAINTWYHSYSIYNPTTNASDYIYSVSASAPTLPSGYTRYKRLRAGQFLTDGSSNIIPLLSDGIQTFWTTVRQDINVTNPGTSAVLRTLSVPLGIVTMPIASYTYGHPNASTVYNCLITGPAQTDSVPSASLYTIQVRPAAQIGTYSGKLKTNTSSQIRSRTDFSNVDSLFAVLTYGWEDPNL